MLFHMNNSALFKFFYNPVSLKTRHPGLGGDFTLGGLAALFQKELHYAPIVVPQEFEYYPNVCLHNLFLFLNRAVQNVINNHARNDPEQPHYHHEMNMMV